MNALVDHQSFASAYRQLRPVERAFVDAVVADMEQSAHRANERISLALYRPIPQHIATKDDGMLEKPLVRAAITERINEIAAANELTVQRMVKEYMAIAFSSIGDYQTICPDTGEIVFDLTRCTPEQLAAVKQIRIEEGSNSMDMGGKRKCTIVLHDKLTAMKALAEFMGMLQPDNPHWQAQSARPAAPLRAGTTAAAAADAYAALIG